MSRLTKEIKDFKAYTLSSAFISEIPDPIYGKKYCGEAINKLGELEDVFEIIEKMYNQLVYYKTSNGDVYCDDYSDSTILYNPKDNKIYIYEYSYIIDYDVREYGKEWWVSQDDFNNN